ncbi:flagellin N-terminal helical domain-containing protein [Anaerosinus massiliensis]|uniref:flagellin N-terminal helical domain-containing protein n=1 Tax=Massilibacillus massiliensis TaxID=1806837 RepID=UPI000AB2A59C|nr:flagellin [Massilibacillus massiliensis]
MSLVVKNNLSALNTLNIMNSNSSALNKSMKKVSSGMKINGAADDASGYQISERMRVQIRSLDQANANTQNGSSLLKTAEGAVSSTVEILKTLKEKVLNAANGTNTESELSAIQSELDQSIDQINDNANVTFNGKSLVNGSMNSEVKSATNNVFTNNKLHKDTAAGSVLTTITDRSGNSLGIVSGDHISVSYTINGKTVTSTLTVGTSTSLQSVADLMSSKGTLKAATSVIGMDKNGYTVNTVDSSNVISITAASAGVEGAIAGFTINVTDRNNNVKKNVIEKLDAFSESIAAENGSGDNSLKLQVGTKSNQTITVAFADMGAKALGLQGSTADGDVNLDVTTQERATAAINVLDSAIQRALNQQTKIGAAQSRLEYTSQNLTTSSENVTNAESTIRDADMAKEMMTYQKNNILKQASQAMLAQANQNGQGVLSLLQ